MVRFGKVVFVFDGEVVSEVSFVVLVAFVANYCYHLYKNKVLYRSLSVLCAYLKITPFVLPCPLLAQMNE